MQFYKETEFKKVKLNGRDIEIPKDWEVVRLGEILTLRNGERPQLVENGKYPVYGANGIMGYSNDYLVDKDFTIIIGRVGASGEVHLGKGKIWISDNAIYSESYDMHRAYPPFVYYLLKFKQLNKFATRTTHPIITQNFLKSLLISLPPLEEQKKIAEILSTVDEAIQKTDEAIEKTKRIKEGLMQRLLTRGLGHKEFKKVKLNGRDIEIPKDWEVVKLEDVIIEAKPGFACGKRDDNGIIQLRMDSIDPDGRINPNAYVKVPPPENVEEYILKPGDILFNNTNSVDLIGKTAIFRGEFPKCVYSNHLTRIRVNPNKTIPEWILYTLIRLWKLGVFKAICRRHVHQAGINTKDLVNLKIPLPPLDEQKKIAEILSTIDKKLEILREEKKRLENVKKGLMQKLLTGKVRVVV